MKYSAFTLESLIQNDSLEESIFDSIEKSINFLPAPLLLKALSHHLFYEEISILTPTMVQAIDDCVFAQHANNGFMFALFDPFGKLLHLYNEKMFITRKNGVLMIIGMTGSEGSIKEVPLNDPFLKFIFIALENGKIILPQESNTGKFKRSMYNLGGNKSLLTSTIGINAKGLLMNGYVMGLSEGGLPP